jgi:carboxymethylenebutenolidase
VDGVCDEGGEGPCMAHLFDDAAPGAAYVGDVTIATSYERITAQDGGSFDAFCALPDGGTGPGILLFQEIFGINDNMRGLAERLAGEGFVVLVPDMFWRLEPRFERKDESGLGDAFAMVQRYDWDHAAPDIAATHAHLLGMSASTGKVGAIGFCFGGGLAFLAGVASRVEGRGPDAVVSYYGSPVNGMLGQVDSLECPTLFHYGSKDAFLPKDLIDEVEAAVAGKPGVELHRYEAGHAFSNWDAPSMSDEAAATEAWARTIPFLHRHLDG